MARSVPNPRGLAEQRVCRQHDGVSSTRLALALSTSGLVLGCTAAGEISWFVSALFAPAPLLLAVRCLPKRVGLPLAFCIGAIALFVTARGRLEGAELVTSVLACAALWLLPFWADRLCATWLRRVGFLAFPLAAEVLARLGAEVLPESIAGLLAHPARHSILDVWAHDLSRTVVDVALWTLASATSGLAGVHNWHVPDPYTQEQREDGLKLAGSSVLVLFLVVFVLGWLRMRDGAPTSEAAWHSDLVVGACGAGLVVLLAMAFVVRRDRAPLG
jgi:hypothetical protein